MVNDNTRPTDIPYVDLGAQYRAERDQLLPAIETVLESGHYVGGAVVDELEPALAEACGTQYCVAVNSGTDALILSLAALGIGPGDEVITQANSFIASAAAIVQVGAKPVYADVLPDQSIAPDDMEAKITDRTRAILPVHLTGRIGDMDAINAIAAKHGLAVIEDAAQAFGSEWRGARAGSLGAVGAFSAHPLKNLNAAGDAGFITTDDQAVYEFCRLSRNHGMQDRNTVVRWGGVSRLDALQAAILLARLPGVPEIIECRRANAARYSASLNRDLVYIPEPRPYALDSFHTFVVQLDGRDELVARLASEGIGSAIHYPIPIHRQPVSQIEGRAPCALPETEHQAGRILSLPIHQHLTDDDIDRVVAVVNDHVETGVREAGTPGRRR